MMFAKHIFPPLGAPHPTAYGGRVYISNESGRMYCLDAADGDLLWSYDLPVDAWPDMTGLSSPAVAVIGEEQEARLFVGCDNGYVYCLSTADNPPQREAWPAPYYAGACVESSPTVYADRVYVGTSWYSIANPGYEVIALNALTGTYCWGDTLTAEVRATCAAANGDVYVGVDTGRRFHRLGASSGVWNGFLELAAGNYFVGSTALCSADLAFVGNDNGSVYALQQSNLSTPLSTYTTGGVVCSSPAISYCAEPNYRWFYVLSRGTGGQGMLYAFRKQR